MNIINTKPDWMSEATWRAVRTCIQFMAAEFGAVLLTVLMTYKSTHSFDLSALYYNGVVGAIIVGLGWAMNRKQ